MTIVRTILAVLLGTLLTPTQAQHWEVHDMAGSGFPSNTVLAIVQDGTGTIWAATDWGLVRSEGEQWTVYQQGTSGLPDNYLRCIAVDGEDRLWVGTTHAGIAILEGEEWTYLNSANSPLLVDEISGITHDHRGWAWIATELGLHCWTGTEWFLYDDTPQSHDGHQFFGPNIKATAVREDGLVAIATRNAGLTYISETDFIYYTSFNSGFPDNSANGVVFDASGDRWIATLANGLIRHVGPHVGGPWFVYDGFTSGFPDNTLTSIVIDAEGRKIMGTETAGIIVFESPAQWSTLDVANSGLPDGHVRSLLIDADGGLWAGTNNGGLARYHPVSSAGSHMGEGGRAMRVYPVPFQEGFTVEWGPGTDIGRAHWRLLDGTGRIVRDGTRHVADRMPLSLPDLPPGMYVLEVTTGRGRSALRAVRE